MTDDQKVAVMTSGATLLCAGGVAFLLWKALRGGQRDGSAACTARLWLANASLLVSLTPLFRIFGAAFGGSEAVSAIKGLIGLVFWVPMAGGASYMIGLFAAKRSQKQA